MNRREFVCQSAFGIAAAAATRLQLTEPTAGKIFRTITYNIRACSGYPKRKENRERLQRAQSQIPARLAMELQLYQPDVVTFQESPAEPIIADIAKQMSMRYTYFPGGFPGALLTRHKIKEATNCPMVGGGDRPKQLFTRHWGRAVVQTPDHHLVIYSAHLVAGDRDDIRTREADAMIDVMSNDLESNTSVIMQGDLNHGPDSPLYQRWKDAGLSDTFDASANAAARTYSSTQPRWRIDYIWSSGPISQQLTDCRVLAEGAFVTNPIDKASFALSDHLPVLATFTYKPTNDEEP